MDEQLAQKDEKVARGERLRKVREAKGLTREELGERVGYSRSTIQRFEQGKDPPFSVAGRMAEELGLSVEYYYYGSKKNDAVRSSEYDPVGHAQRDSRSAEGKVLAANPKLAQPVENPEPTPFERALPREAGEPVAPLGASLAPGSTETPTLAQPVGGAVSIPPERTMPNMVEGPTALLAESPIWAPGNSPKLARPRRSPEPVLGDSHRPAAPRGAGGALRRILVAVLPPFVVAWLGSERHRLLTWIVGYSVCAGVFILFPAVPLRWHALGVAVCGFFILQLSMRFSALDREARATRPHRARGSA